MCIRDSINAEYMGKLDKKCEEKLEKMADLNTQYDKQARTNLNRKDYHLKDYKIFGSYEFVPLPKEKMAEMDAALLEINRVITPTVRRLNSEANIMEIQERLYRKILPWETEMNTCLFQARDAGDANFCGDKFLARLKSEGIRFAADLMKEY
eukprot:TRINITY_DN2602_c0_g6_i2.p2 TRINITY_DN2602_c0_g6~~TRINITY_DN2602_c0_g6_i2.p2  ORF type:complete len:152 (+),score=45.84 TRINITY_DN2602_c0_g6_i2:66-521(+)